MKLHEHMTEQEAKSLIGKKVKYANDLNHQYHTPGYLKLGEVYTIKDVRISNIDGPKLRFILSNCYDYGFKPERFVLVNNRLHSTGGNV